MRRTRGRVGARTQGRDGASSASCPLSTGVDSAQEVATRPERAARRVVEQQPSSLRSSSYRPRLPRQSAGTTRGESLSPFRNSAVRAPRRPRQERGEQEAAAPQTAKMSRRRSESDGPVLNNRERTRRGVVSMTKRDARKMLAGVDAEKMHAAAARARRGRFDGCLQDRLSGRAARRDRSRTSSPERRPNSKVPLRRSSAKRRRSARPSEGLVRLSWFCYALQEDGIRMPTLQK